MGNTIKAEFDSLRKTSVSELRALVKQAHRVFDTSELSKMDLVYTILRARHGQAALRAAGIVD